MRRRAGSGTVFPVCPGVAGGRFDPAVHRLRQFRYGEVTDDLQAVRTLLQRFNPAMSMILTVSPVPLTATATGDHVLAATAQAKATLRAAAGDFAADTDGVDYFPSFELVTSHATGGPWFEPNLRAVSEAAGRDDVRPARGRGRARGRRGRSDLRRAAVAGRRTMSAKVLVLGNSHIRALRDALEATPDRWAALDIDIVALRGPMLSGIEVAEGQIRPVTDTAREQFQLQHEQAMQQHCHSRL